MSPNPDPDRIGTSLVDIMKSRYEQLLDAWYAMGGGPQPRTGPAWNWRPNPPYDWLVSHLAYAPVDLT